MAFQCVIVTPEQQVLDEQVRQVILPAHDGQLGILTGRAPLLAKLGVGRLTADLAGGGQRVLLVDGGIAQMVGNVLTVLTDAAWAPGEVDADAARAEYAEATARKPADERAAADRERRMRRAKMKEEFARAK